MVLLAYSVKESVSLYFAKNKRSPGVNIKKGRDDILFVMMLLYNVAFLSCNLLCVPFRVMVGAVVVACLLGCGYWRKRKIYESSASQTLAHPHHHHHHHPFSTPTPSDDTPTYGPPLPFLPPAPYPAPPPYSEAAKPSFDPQEHHLFDAVLAGQ